MFLSVFLFCFFFFFSSRRRHTRSKRDWSSDVCSSDLLSFGLAISPPLRRLFVLPYHKIFLSCPMPLGTLKFFSPQQRVCGYLQQRSEERRVGKECSCRW